MEHNWVTNYQTNSKNLIKSEDNISIWRGILNLEYQHKDDRTQIKSSYTRSPLKIQQPFYPENQDVCHTVIIHTAGGIVGGDVLSQNIYLGNNCHSFITTPAAGKIYKTNGQTAEQNIKIKIENNSCLEYFPQENIIFNGAKYQQNYRIELAENAHYCTWEINRFGRTARGEKFIQGDWKSSCEITQNNQLIWVERQWLPGNDITCQSINGLNNYAVCASFYWLGSEIPLELVTRCRELAQLHIQEGEAGVTPMVKGLLCRYRGNSVTELKRWFIEVWAILRTHFLQRDKIIPRVWQISSD